MRLKLRIGKVYRDCHEVVRRRFIHIKALQENAKLRLRDRWDQRGRSTYIDIVPEGAEDELLGTIRVTRCRGVKDPPGVIADWTRKKSLASLPSDLGTYDVTRCAIVQEGRGFYSLLLQLAAWWVKTQEPSATMCCILRKELTTLIPSLNRAGFEVVESCHPLYSYDVPGQQVEVLPLLQRLSKRNEDGNTHSWQDVLKRLEGQGMEFPEVEEIAATMTAAAM